VFRSRRRIAIIGQGRPRLLSLAAALVAQLALTSCFLHDATYLFRDTVMQLNTTVTFVRDNAPAAGEVVHVWERPDPHSSGRTSRVIADDAGKVRLTGYYCASVQLIATGGSVSILKGHVLDSYTVTLQGEVPNPADYPVDDADEEQPDRTRLNC
jgi:hypothetical protein